MQDLGTLGGSFSEPVDINDAGQVTGNSSTASGSSCPHIAIIDPGCHAFVWDGTTMHDLGSLGGDFSEATAINAAGHVTGITTTASGAVHAFYWDGTTMHDLGSLGGTLSIGYAVNTAGKVVGEHDRVWGLLWGSGGGLPRVLVGQRDDAGPRNVGGRSQHGFRRQPRGLGHRHEHDGLWRRPRVLLGRHDNARPRHAGG